MGGINQGRNQGPGIDAHMHGNDIPNDTPQRRRKNLLLKYYINTQYLIFVIFMFI
jgi:hypothetical protein